MTPRRPVRATLWHRLPGIVVALACLNRATFLIDDRAPLGRHVHGRWLFATLFAACGLVGLVWNLSAPWRSSHLHAPWVALATMTAYLGYATAVTTDFGFGRVRGTAVDHVALALLIAWSWGGPERLDEPAEG